MTVPTTPAPTAERWDLVGRLERLAENEDRGALAELRRGLGKERGYSTAAARIVEPTLRQQATRAQADAHYLVASLFGLHPHHADTPDDAAFAERSLGWSLRAARWRDGEEDRGVERRFMALLQAEADGLAEHLRHLIKLGVSRNDALTIDYRQLLSDVRNWDASDRHVQRRWAAGFWAGGAEKDAAAPSDADTDSVDADGDSDDDDE